MITSLNYNLRCGVLVKDTVHVTPNCFPNIWELLPFGSYLLLSSNLSDLTVPDNLDKLNFQNKNTIIAVAVDQPTFYYSVRFKPEKESNGNDEFAGGINVEAYRFLTDSLNFQEKALKSRGSMKANKKGELENQGIAQVLNSNQADIAISLFDPLPYRVAGPFGVRFLHAVFKSSKATAIFTQPPKNSARNIYGLPFQEWVWIAAVFLYILVLLTLWVLLVVQLKLVANGQRKFYRLSPFQNCKRVHLWILSILARQGFTDLLMDSSYLKVALVTCFMASVIFHSVYSSGLTSILAVDYKPISSFNQLVAKQYKMYYDKYVPSIQDIVKNFSRLNISVVAMGSDVTNIMEKASPEIFNSKSALLTSEDRYYPLFKKRYEDGFLCNKLSKLNIISVSVRNANFVKQGSPYRDVFNIKFLLMQQSGIIERLYNEHDLRSRLTCLESFDPDFLSLDIFDTGLPFLILFYVTLLSILLLIVENFAKFCFTRVQNHFQSVSLKRGEVNFNKAGIIELCPLVR